MSFRENQRLMTFKYMFSPMHCGKQGYRLINTDMLVIRIRYFYLKYSQNLKCALLTTNAADV